MKANFALLAQYNRNMNRQLYAAASQLSDDELKKDRGAFFPSILATLNHILVGDIIWLKRIAKHPMQLAALEPMHAMPKPQGLNAIICDDLASLTIKRIEVDDIICDFIAQIEDAHIASPFSYINTRGDSFNKNLGAIIQHLFNHQTHHRGQVTTLLYQAGIDPGVTDLLMVIPDETA